MKVSDFSKWSPITLLAVISVVLVVAGGVVTVIVTAGDPNPYTYREFLDDLKYVASALAIGAGVGRGILKGKQAEADARVRTSTVKHRPTIHTPPDDK